MGFVLLGAVAGAAARKEELRRSETRSRVKKRSFILNKLTNQTRKKNAYADLGEEEVR